ncbi:MAG: hypothetical protein LW809_07555 [Vampirovibrionales bacterium]|jgi:hypothetical protein|nr:hypothetical protein [Vampirovibrionales bacterium]
MEEIKQSFEDPENEIYKKFKGQARPLGKVYTEEDYERYYCEQKKSDFTNLADTIAHEQQALRY